jgi:hypothetical protein
VKARRKVDMRYLFRLLISSVVVLVLLATVAGAQDPQREAVIQEITLRGTVTAVDLPGRMVKVRSDQGNTVTLDVPASYARFDQVRVGDIVSVTYYDRVSVRLKPAGEPPVETVLDPTPTTTLAPGLLPGGARVTQRVATVTLDSWDPATRLLSFTTSNGLSYTRRVSDIVDPSVLAGLKVGDRVDVTRTEATNLAVVTPAPPAQGGQAAANPQGGEAVIQEITLRGTITVVDHPGRMVKVHSDQGNTVTLDVPATYTRFDQVRVGDVVTITYYDRVSVRLKLPGEPPVERKLDPTTTTTLVPGLLPGGVRVTERVATVTLDAWDPATRMLSFTTSNGQSYTRRVSDMIDASVLAGLKVGDRVDVTRTEATNLAVVTPAPPAQAAQAESLRHRFTISVLYGIDNSFSGEIAQSGDGTYQGAPISFVDTSFDSVYGKMGLLKVGVGYRTSPRTEGIFNFVWSKSSSEVVPLGTVGDQNAPLSVKFGDYNYWGVEGGQRFYFSRVRFTPFVGYTVGVNRFSDIAADFSAPATGPQPAIAVNASEFYKASWALSGSITGGLLVGLGPIEFMAESGVRFAGGLADVPPLAETGLSHINDDSSRWSIPFLVGVRLRF